MFSISLFYVERLIIRNIVSTNLSGSTSTHAGIYIRPLKVQVLVKSSVFPIVENQCFGPNLC